MSKHLTLLLFIGLAFWNCENEDACQIYKPLAGRYLNWEVDENCNTTIIGIDYGISGRPSHYIYENGEYFQYVTRSDDSGAEWL